MSSSRPLVLVLSAVVAWSLACAGVDPMVDGVEEPAPNPAVSPLLTDRVYYFDDDLAGKPEWDLSLDASFEDGGTCRYGDIEVTMDCTWEGREESDGTWTVQITKFTGAFNGDGPAAIEGEPPGRLTVATDGGSLTEASGRTWVLLPEGEQGIGFHDAPEGGDGGRERGKGKRGGKSKRGR